MNSSSILSIALVQLVQMSLVILLVAIVAKTACRRRPHWAYALWMLALVKCLTPPVVSSPTGVFSWAETLRSSPAVAATVAAGPDAGSSFAAAAAPAAVPLGVGVNLAEPVVSREAAQQQGALANVTWSWSPAAIVMMIWGFGVAAVAVTIAVKAHLVRRLLRRASISQSTELSDLLETVRQRLGVRRPTHLVLLSEPWGPALVGAIRPRLVLPTALAEHKSLAELTPVLAHELVHLRRGDHLVAAVQLVAQAVWWFHPLVWWMNREMNRCREMCCDEEVIAGLSLNPGDYAQALVDVVRLRRQLRPLVFAPGMSPLQVTTARLQHIMADAGLFHRRAPALSWLIVALAALALLPGAGWAWTEASTEQQNAQFNGAASSAEGSSDEGIVFGFTTVATPPEAGQNPPVDPADDALEWTIVDGVTKQPLTGVELVVEHIVNTLNGRKLLQTTRHITDTAGRARIEIPPAEANEPSLAIILQGTRTGYAPLARIQIGYHNVRLYKKHGVRTWYQEQRMYPGEEITGVIVDSTGKPMADLPVHVYSERGRINARNLRDAARHEDDDSGSGTFVYTADGQFVSSSTEVRTDQQGRFSTYILKESKGVLAVRPTQYAAMTRPIAAPGGDLGTFRLEPGVRVRGRVLDAAGNPCAGVWVNITGGKLREANQVDVTLEQTSRAAKTSSDGTFELEPIIPGSYRAHVSGQNDSSSLAFPYSLPLPGVFEPVTFEITADQVPAPVEFRAIPHAVIQIDFVDGTGQPAAGGDVVVEGRRNRQRWSRVMRGNAQGKIEAFVPRDLTRVKVSPVGDESFALRTRLGDEVEWQFRSQIELSDLAARIPDVHVQKLKAPTLWLNIHNDEGEVENSKAQIKLDGVDENQLRQLVRPEVFPIGKGKWRTIWLQPEMPFTITIETPGKKPVTKTFKLAEGEDKTVEIKLEPDAS